MLYRRKASNSNFLASFARAARSDQEISAGNAERLLEFPEEVGDVDGHVRPNLPHDGGITAGQLLEVIDVPLGETRRSQMGRF